MTKENDKGVALQTMDEECDGEDEDGVKQVGK